MINEYLPFGEILKPQGIDGTVKIRPENSEQEYLKNVSAVFLKNGASYKACTAEQLRMRDGFIYGRINQAADRNAAEEQRGWVLYIDRAHAAPLAENEHYICDVIGCTLMDENDNIIGTVVSITKPARNDIYEIKTARGTLYFPALPFVMKKIDVENNHVVVDAERLAEVAVLEN